MSKKAKYRYSIGIDLGTSNCALSYIDLRSGNGTINVLEVPQWETFERVVHKNVLPSFLYYPTVNEVLSDEMKDWDERKIVGTYARNVSEQSPERVISSAKSWLCHKAVDREAKILPWGSDKIKDERKYSPVEASSLYLKYLKFVWDEDIAKGDTSKAFDNQQVVITVPASFDQDAQKLTHDAAIMAEYPKNVRLLEEPQAAFHSWVEQNNRNSSLQETLRASGDKKEYTVLVCDIGGGTSDFSTFSVSFSEDGESSFIRRVAVSEHILLGGDNIDIAVARLLEQKMNSGELSLQEWQSLVTQTRKLKEKVLTELDERTAENNTENETFHISVGASGGSLFKKRKSVKVTFEEIKNIVFESFFPVCSLTDKPIDGGQGLMEMGLAYAKDYAVTRYLAEFVEGQKSIDAILFNGGTITSKNLQKRVVETITQWQNGIEPTHLSNEELYLTVAKGAAAYGRDIAFRKKGLISAGSAHTYYLEIKSSNEKSHFVTILPYGSENEERFVLDKLNLYLLVNQPVEFQVFSSVKRTQDPMGQLIKKTDEGFTELPPLQSFLRYEDEQSNLKSREIPVVLETYLNALGLLQVFVVENDREKKEKKRWKLEFNLRGIITTTESNVKEIKRIPDEQIEEVNSQIQTSFDLSLLKSLEKLLHKKKNSWNRVWLRQMWPLLHSTMTKRKANGADYEAAWLNAAGYFLRPGYGVALDDERINELWYLHTFELDYPNVKSVREQYFIMWRRVAGGLSSQQQTVLYDEIEFLLKTHVKQSTEAFKMVSSFELLPIEKKEHLFTLLLEGLQEKKDKYCEHYLWGLGRLLGRVPLYAGSENVLSPSFVKTCFEKLCELDWQKQNLSYIPTLLSLICRRTNIRTVDIDMALSEKVIAKLVEFGAKDSLVRPIREYIEVTEEDVNVIYGEKLPAGLSILQFD